jgi:dTDP-4-amino-4,6-dideoxygalactose transaminase
MKKISFMRNFGHNGPYEYSEVGINGKNSELHAAVGLVNLTHFQEIKSHRKSICEAYLDNLLRDNIFLQKWKKQSTNNHSYFPILLSEEININDLLLFLNKNDIFPRRYFYPSLSSVELFSKKENTPVSLKISSQIICLPLYVGLDPSLVIDNFNSYLS